jgi:GAF domain-containing protein/anti-sigma regulatory factor (Ser/Thr protein kinase)/ActR/RegA family two-component response regulator
MNEIRLLLIAPQAALVDKVSRGLAAEIAQTNIQPQLAIDHVTTAVAGIAAAQTSRFDAALMQMNSPDGYDLTAVRQFHAQMPGLPLILLGEIDDHNLSVAAVQAGAQNYLVISELDDYWLIRIIRHAIERHQNTEAIRRYAQFQEALNAVTRLALQPLPFDEMLRQLANETKTLFNCDGCYITGWDEAKRQTFPLTASDPLGDIYRLIPTTPNEKTLTSVALDKGQISITEDLLSNKEVAPRLAQSLPARALLTVPLIAGERKLGALLLAYNQPHRYTSSEIEQAEQLGRQLSLAIAQARLLQEEQNQRRLTNALRKAAAAVTSTLDLNQVLDLILAHLGQVIAFDSACVFLRDEDCLVAVAGLGLPNIEQILGLRMTIKPGDLHDVISQTQQPIIIRDVKEDGRFRFWADTDYIRSWIGLPLRARGRVIGHLTVDHKDVDVFTPQDSLIALAFADQAAVAIENARLFAAEQKRNDELQRLMEVAAILVEVAAILRAAASRSEALPRIGDLLNNLLEAEGIILALAQLDSGELMVELGRGVWQQHEKLRLPPGSELYRRLWQSSGTIYVHDESQAAVEACLTELSGGQKVGAAVGAPLVSQGVNIGVIWAARRRPFTAEEVNLLVTISDMIANALHRATLYERAERQVALRTAELAAANERLRSLDELKSKFVNDISHELRTPLAALNVHLYLLESNPPPHKAEEYLTTLKQQLERLTSIADKINSLLEMESQKETAFAPLDLQQLLYEAEAKFKPLATANGLTWRLAAPEEKLWLNGDRRRIQLAVHHLAQNAVNYTEMGQVELGARPSPTDAGRVELWVTDSGKGISQAEMGYIFEPFYRGERVGQSNIPGMGLGLALVQKIIAAHNGAVEVAANEMGGTTFRLSFPRLEPQPPDDEIGYPSPTFARRERVGEG